MKITHKYAEKFLVVNEVEMREPLAGDYAAVDRQCAKADNNGDNYRTAVLLSRICKFDGESLPPEEILKMRGSDFLALFGEMAEFASASAASEMPASPSGDTQASASESPTT